MTLRRAEAEAVAAVYSFLISNFIYRDMGPLKAGIDRPARSLASRPWVLVTAWFHADTRQTLFEAGKLAVMLMFIIANALILKHVLTDE